jgi:iron(III) transport system permease protein
VRSALRRARIPEIACWTVVMAAIGFLVLWPLLQLQFRAFADGGAAFKRVASLPRIGKTLRTTLFLGVGSVMVAVAFGTMLAWCATQLPRRARRVLSVVPLMPLVVPAVAAVTGWAFLLSPTVGYINILLRKMPVFSHFDAGPINVYSIPGIVIITGINLTSFVYLFVNTSLRNMGQEYEVAAAASGASRARAFFTITLPLLRPALVYSTGIVLLLGMGQFTAPLLLGRGSRVDVLSTEMFKLTLSFPVDYGVGAALGAPLIILGVAVVLLQRLVVGDQRRFVVVGARSRYTSAESRWWSVVVIVLYGLVAMVLPLLALIHVALSPFWTGQFTFGNLTTRHVSAVLHNSAMINAVSNSIRMSVLAVLVVLPLGFLAAWGLMGRGGIRSPMRAVLDLLVQIPLAIPASLLGFGLLFAYTRPPFVLYGTTAVMVITYVTLMIPHATRLQLTTLIGLGNESWEASRACGAGPVRTFARILVPMARKGIAASAAIMIVLLVHEFSASLMVRSIRTQVMGSLLYDVFTGGIYPQVAVIALLMVVVTTVGVAIAIAIGGSDSLGSI